MTKDDFYRDVANGSGLGELREGGLYHYSRTPKKALRYRKRSVERPTMLFNVRCG